MKKTSWYRRWGLGILLVVPVGVQASWFSRGGEEKCYDYTPGLRQSIEGVDKNEINTICVEPREVSLSSNREQDCVQSQGQRLSFFESGACYDLAVEPLCEQPVSASLEQQWDDRLSEREAITESQALLTLLKLQKPGLLKIDRDLPLLLGILHSPLAQKETAALARALQSLYFTSATLYQQVLADFASLAPVLARGSNHRVRECRSASDHALLKKALKPLVENSMYAAPGGGRFQGWSFLAPLGGLLATLPEGERSQFHDHVAQTMTDFVLTQELPELTPNMESKVYQFAFAATAPFFGRSMPVITELTYARERTKIRPVILSTGDLAVASAEVRDAEGGFLYASLPSIDVPVSASPGSLIADLKARWWVQGKKYEAHLKIKGAGTSDRFIPKGETPDYHSLWSDGKLTGLLLVGQNLRGSYQSVRIYEYLKYFKAQGFKLLGDPQPLHTVKEFVQQLVESGELDYWVKEAHMGGAYEMVVEVAQKSLIDVLERVIPKTGQREKVFIIYPHPLEESPGVGISNREMASWFRQREKNSGHRNGPLLFINSSCMSETTTVRQMEAVRSPLFIPIPTINYTTGILGQGSSFGQSPLLDGIRFGASYAQMKERMKALSPEEEQEEEFNDSHPNFAFIFPPDKEYDQYIVQTLKTPLDLELIITENGRPYSHQSNH